MLFRKILYAKLRLGVRSGKMPYSVRFLALVGLCMAIGPGALLAAPASSIAPAHTLKGSIKVDGSSTVFPLTEAVGEEFRKTHKRIRLSVSTSGTGGGFKKFLANNLDIVAASRRISAREKKQALKNQVTYTEIPVALDGIVVVVNKNNTWAKDISVQELRRIWQVESKVKSWSDIRPSWPAQPIRLYGPGTDSGTFDYFTRVINGKAGSSRSDFMRSEDDHQLVTGVMGNKDALAYFGYAHYKSNASKIRALKIKHTHAAVAPSPESIGNSSYTPLSRKVFLYANKNSIQKPHLKSFVLFYLNQVPKLAPEVGYVPLSQNQYKKLSQTITQL